MSHSRKRWNKEELQIDKVFKYLQSIVVGFFGVGLDAVNILSIDCGDKLIAVKAFANDKFIIAKRMKRVNKIEIGIV